MELDLNEKQIKELLELGADDSDVIKCMNIAFGHLFRDLEIEKKDDKNLLLYNKCWSNKNANDTILYYTEQMLTIRMNEANKEIAILTKKLDDNTLIAIDKQDIEEKISHLKNIVKSSNRIISKVDYSKYKKLFEQQLYLNIEPEIFELPKWDKYLNVNNGVIDLSTGELLSHDSSFMFNYVSPVNYYQDKTYDYTLWETQLNETIKYYDEIKEYLQILFGYLLVGGNRSKKALMFTGKKDSGKSSVINILSYIMGDGYWKLVFNSVSRNRSTGNDQNFDLADTRFKRIVSVAEPDNKISYNASIIKDISGNEKINAAKKGKQAQIFRPTYKLVIASNFDLIGDILDDAFFNRFIIVPFYVGYKIKNDYRDIELINDSEAILHWLVEGAIKYYQLGTLPPMPQKLVDLINKTKQNQNPVYEFLSNNEYTITHDQDDKLISKDIYNEFIDWFIENKNGVSPSINEFYKLLNNLDIIETSKPTKINGKTVRCILGIKKV